MAIKIGSDGTFQIEYEGGPFAGLDVQRPETLISDKASPDFNNFILRNSEIRSRPALVTLFGGAGFWELGVSSFLDINGTYHTVLWSGQNLYQYNPTTGPPPWDLVGQCSPGDMQTNPVAYRSFANTIYYTNVGFIASTPGSHKPPVITPFMGYWNGISANPVFTNAAAPGANSAAAISLADSPTVGGSLPGAPTITGPIDIGAGFIGELANHLILANVTIKDEGTGTIYPFPNLIWWSANGLPLQWDPTQNTSAGFNPFLDVSDQITGLATLGIAGYIFRTEGITQMTPTGSGLAPFEFDHMWASDHGIGNVLPWSIAQYGPQAAFVGEDNIYALSVTSAEPIGGGCRDAIMRDIANVPFGWVPFGQIIPKYKKGYVYLTYNLFIPFADFVRMYIYSFEEKNWAPQDLAITFEPPFPALTCAPNVV